MQTYTLRGVTGASWNGIRTEFYISQADNLLALLVDNINLQYKPSLGINETSCTINGLAATGLTEIMETPTSTASNTPTITPSLTITSTATHTHEITLTATATETPVIISTETQTETLIPVSETPTATQTEVETPTATFTETPTLTATPSETPTVVFPTTEPSATFMPPSATSLPTELPIETTPEV
jgi:hypothetical protein